MPKSERCHSRKCLQESVDVYRGVSFGIQLTSRHAQQSRIPVTFRKILRNRCLHQMTKFKGVICHETCQGFRCCVSLISGTTALTTINKRLKKEKWTTQARRALAHPDNLCFFRKKVCHQFREISAPSDFVCSEHNYYGFQAYVKAESPGTSTAQFKHPCD